MSSAAAAVAAAAPADADSGDGVSVLSEEEVESGLVKFLASMRRRVFTGSSAASAEKDIISLCSDDADHDRPPPPDSSAATPYASDCSSVALVRLMPRLQGSASRADAAVAVPAHRPHAAGA
jgi:hypothetical protein